MLTNLLAGAYIIMHWNDDFSKAPIYPTSGCQLDLSHGTITYKLKRELRWARTEPPYREYVCKKYKWSLSSLVPQWTESYDAATTRG